MTKFIATIRINLVTPKAPAKLELLFNQQRLVCLTNAYAEQHN
jgi:hypothetical protein